MIFPGVGSAVVTDETYLGALHRAMKHLELTPRDRDQAERRLKDIDAKVTRLRRVVVSLSDICGEPTELTSLGITEACRTVMANASEKLRMRGVKDELTALGFDLSSQKNADASVMAILTRLVAAGEIRCQVMKTSEGRTDTLFLGPNVPGDNTPPLRRVPPPLQRAATLNPTLIGSARSEKVVRPMVAAKKARYARIVLHLGHDREALIGNDWSVACHAPATAYCCTVAAAGK
jgi:hypothetical protein